MIWFDVTEVKNWQGHHTGIQRVIAKLGEHLSENEDFHPCYFDYSTNTFRIYEYEFTKEVEYTNEDKNIMTIVRAEAQTLVDKLKKKSPLKIKNNIKRILSVGGIRNGSVIFEPGDVLFIPGAFWVYSFDQLKILKEQHNIGIVGVMYDLVPLVTPQFTAKVTIDGFNARFDAAIEVFDYWFAISNNTKSDMLTAAKDRGSDLASDSIEVIRLGVDEKDKGGATTKPKNTELKSEGFALFVSTIEARKNQTLVYQAIKRLQEEEYKHLPIVLVGKHGWLSDDIIYILRSDPTIKDKLIWLDRVDDKSLRWLYENCAFTIYPSYYEGWGLPVAESLAQGKACIASNASSIPEVAGNLIEYFSPYSSDELAELIHKYSDVTYLNDRKSYVRKFQAPTWAACAEQVHNSLRILSTTLR